MDVFLIVIDGFGIGALPDASNYGDAGANTAVHISEVLNGVSWPTLQRWGLGNAADLLDSRIIGCPPCEKPQGWFGIMAEKSSGKDTTTGHWELAGIILEKPFPVFKPEFPSFPPALIDDFVRENAIPGILGNKSASGTVIIEELGEEHIQSRKPVCYTSADSVFQIATHEEIYPLDDLYSMCKKARLICDHYNIGRVIARPFIGKPGNFRRTAGRHDWSIDLPSESLLDHLSQRGVQTVAVGKIGAIFNEQGIDISYHDAGNELCILRTLELARQKHSNDRFVFVNLVDTDMIFGHRRDPEGYHDAVGRIDSFLGELESLLPAGNMIIVAADHGCDPAFHGTDHTREYAPVLCRCTGYKNNDLPKMNLGVRDSFSDVSASIQNYYGLEKRGMGKSFNQLIFTY